MIVLLGSSGYVGGHFRQTLDARGLKCAAIRSSEVDLLDERQLDQALNQIQPEFVINCAGFTGKPNVDACELQKTECLSGNAVLPGVLAKVCRQRQIPWGHVSSGCIYTGGREDGKGFTESDKPNFSFRQNNCSFYSGTKALAEEILATEPHVYVWRLRIPFNHEANPRNYLQKVMSYDRLLEAENSLSNLEEFVEACIDCYRMQLPFGIYNLTNPGSVWTSQVCELISKAGITNKHFQFFGSEQEFMQIAAKTPRSNCVLDSSKALAAGLKLTPVVEVLERCLVNWKSAAMQAGK